MDSGPPPPPHGSNPKHSGLPPGNYDIFIIPPHSSGSGFVYLPSLQPHRNSFLAGVVCTLFAVGIWTLVVPVIKQWMATVMASGGTGVILLVLGVGVLGWAFGKTQQENTGTGSGGNSADGAGPSFGPGPSPEAHTNSGGSQQGPQPHPTSNTSGFNPRPGHTFSAGAREGAYTGPRPTWQSANAEAGASGWEKAREEMKKREEERKKKEEVEKKAKEAEQKAKEAAEKERWEKARVREKEAREKEARDKAVQEKLRKEKEAGETGKAKPEKPESERTGAAAAAAAAAGAGSASNAKHYRKPTAQSFVDDEEIHSFRPYDTPSKRHTKTATSSQSSFYSEPSSYAASQSTSRTTPPHSHRSGPYTTKDPDKIVIKAVYSFTDLFPKPGAQLVSGAGSVTDGLVLRITTEGLFIDDDVRGVPQREWDVKAWTMKLIESSTPPPTPTQSNPYNLLRATLRDANSKTYVFVIDESEAWKVAVGLQRLRRGNLVRSLGVQGFAKGEGEKILGSLGW